MQGRERWSKDRYLVDEDDDDDRNACAVEGTVGGPDAAPR